MDRHRLNRLTILLAALTVNGAAVEARPLDPVGDLDLAARVDAAREQLAQVAATSAAGEAASVTQLAQWFNWGNWRNLQLPPDDIVQPDWFNW